MFSTEQKFGINVIEVKEGERDSNFVVVSENLYKLKLPKKAKEIMVRAFEGSHFVCLLKDKRRTFIGLP